MRDGIASTYEWFVEHSESWQTNSAASGRAAKGPEAGSRAVLMTTDIEKCRMCGSSADLRGVFDLGVQAIAGRFPGPGESDAPEAPLRLLRCMGCGLVQLAHSIDLNELYRSGYGYRSGINATMRNHLAGIVERITSLASLGPGDTVLDIASNDGTLLKNYRVNGLRRVGIDPTIAQYRSFYPGDILVADEFFSADTFQQTSGVQKANVITSIAMFYDLSDPNAFVSDIVKILDGEGIWVLEQSDLRLMLRTKSFDTICHEHLEYYGTNQIEAIVKGHGLRIFDLEANTINGGSTCFYVCHENGPYDSNNAALANAKALDQADGIDRLETYAAFVQAADDLRFRLRGFIEKEKAKGRVTHVYGASTKGNVLLQYCGINAQLVPAAADRNPRKWGHRTPGTNIPIVSEKDSRAANPNYYLVLPWHFRDEFVEREEQFIARGGRLIFPLPELEIYPPLNEDDTT